MLCPVSERPVVSIFIGRVGTHATRPMQMEQTECSETSAYKIQTPGNYPKIRIRHSQHGESLKSRTIILPVVLCEYDGWSLITERVTWAEGVHEWGVEEDIWA
jgi:hypothetical protein